MTRSRAVLGAVLLLGGACAAEEGPDGTEPARKLPEIKETGCHYLWEIRSGETTVCVLGTIHAAPADLYPLPQAVLDAYARSQEIAVEFNPSTPQEAMQMQKGMSREIKYPEGESLKDHVPEALFARLQEFCKKDKLPFKLIQQHRPWAISSFIENRKLKGLAARPENGIEIFFLDKVAGAGKKKVRSLEGIDRLEAPWAKDDPETAALVEQIIGEHSAVPMKDLLDWTIEAWKAGDAEAEYEQAVAGQIRRYPGLMSYFKRMVFDRNTVMADSIEKFLKGDRTVFCMIGMMHCGSDQGVPALLAKRGYAVTQVARKAPAK